MVSPRYTGSMFLQKPFTDWGPPYLLNVDTSVLLGYADAKAKATLDEAIVWCEDQLDAGTWGYNSDFGVFSFSEPWQQAAFRIRWG
ncbi:MAG: hypothetical protein EOP83_11495 [Verrucomicrobiaceae bacterium]|nr:MAG: hypothetical protein EOP83_11495 [Verrucomicrobiaceae bacterium]